MPSTTFFGNVARVKLLNTWSAGTYTLTSGSTSFTGTGNAGDYVLLVADGIQFAARVASAGTLAYTYKGTGGTGAGYVCTPETLAALRGLEMNINWETAELYGTDDIRRIDEAKHTLKVNAKIKYAKWDCGITVDWMNAVLRPTGATGDIENTNICYVNGVVFSIVGSGISTTLEIVCGKTYWEGLPYPFPENDFIVRDISGKASSATFNSY